MRNSELSGTACGIINLQQKLHSIIYGLISDQEKMKECSFYLYLIIIKREAFHLIPNYALRIPN